MENAIFNIFSALSSCISERRRSEQALIAVVQEAFINGVSTRKIERLARAMGIENISASQVSEFNKELDAQVEDFRTRPLEEEYPFLWIDALYQRVRVEGRVVSVALMIACGVIDGAGQTCPGRPRFDCPSAPWYLIRPMRNIPAFHHPPA